MELRELAEQIVFATTLEAKLWCPEAVTDEQPGMSREAPAAPGRPAKLRFKPQGSAKVDFPRLHRLEKEHERGRLLHFFANHELLATELMALVLLRFPDAPASFRRGVFQTLRDEQIHTRLYLRRMETSGIQFGDIPVSGYFWRCVSGMEHPIDYVSGLSLTFEQANLDFCRHFAEAFKTVGDEPTAGLLDRIYHDEIGHVAYGLKWFRRWKNPKETDWEAFCHQLKFPLSPQRAKGPVLNVEGRREAGLDPEFIAQLNVYSKSKGRTPSVFVFNPFAEGRIAYGKVFTPRKHQSLLAGDLANLPQFLCRQDDVVLVPKRPSIEFLSTIKQAGFPLPEFIEIAGNELPADCELRQRKIGDLRPWAWGPGSVELFEPLIHNRSEPGPSLNLWFNQRIRELYSKAWSAALLGRILPLATAREWICGKIDVGVAVDNIADANEVIGRIRKEGHHRIIVKEAFGLAGHNAIRLWEPDISEAQRCWMERALQNGRQLVIEPWLEREMDFSVQLEMASNGLKVLGYTGLINDHRGQFQANWAAPNCFRNIPLKLSRLFDAVPDFEHRVADVYGNIFTLLGTELRQAGYVGPLGIDAFAYRSGQGNRRLKPIVEINPRYTMGRLTLELMKRTAPGSFGVFRLFKRTTLRAKGFERFASYAEALRKTAPVLFAGEPSPKIIRGELCLNDASRAEACLATFRVGRTLTEVLDPELN